MYSKSREKPRDFLVAEREREREEVEEEGEELLRERGGPGEWSRVKRWGGLGVLCDLPLPLPLLLCRGKVG